MRLIEELHIERNCNYSLDGDIIRTVFHVFGEIVLVHVIGYKAAASLEDNAISSSADCYHVNNPVIGRPFSHQCM